MRSYLGSILGESDSVSMELDVSFWLVLQVAAYAGDKSWGYKQLTLRHSHS